MVLAASVLMSVLVAGAAGAAEVATVQAPESPVRLDRAMILSSTDAPPVLLYSATNVTGDPLDEFTVMVYVFREGVLKARQVAPGRRTLDAHGTKYSAMVLDGFPIEANDVVVAGVNQAQRVGSDVWWRADLGQAAQASVAAKKPK
jgi:hypothetical protein